MSFKKRATKSIAIALIGVSVGSPLLTTYVSAQTNNISTYYTNKKSVESYTDESCRW